MRPSATVTQLLSHAEGHLTPTSYMKHVPSAAIRKTLTTPTTIQTTKPISTTTTTTMQLTTTTTTSVTQSYDLELITSGS